MSVFRRIEKAREEHNNMEERPCRRGHEWDGVRPKVDPNIHEIQHPELIGRLCSCQKTRYSEDLCGCAVKHWEIKLLMP